MGTYTSNEQGLGDPSKQSGRAISEFNGHWRAAMEADVRAIEADARALEAEAVRFTEDILAVTQPSPTQEQTQSSTEDAQAAQEKEESRSAVDQGERQGMIQQADAPPPAEDSGTGTQEGIDQQPPSQF